MASDKTPADFPPSVLASQTSWCAPFCISKFCLTYLLLSSVISLMTPQYLKDISNTAVHWGQGTGSQPAPWDLLWTLAWEQWVLTSLGFLPCPSADSTSAVSMHMDCAGKVSSLLGDLFTDPKMLQRAALGLKHILWTCLKIIFN
jgi:hypothetical protein